jgi:hypothetical protein
MPSGATFAAGKVLRAASVRPAFTREAASVPAIFPGRPANELPAHSVYLSYPYVTNHRMHYLPCTRKTWLTGAGIWLLSGAAAFSTPGVPEAPPKTTVQLSFGHSSPQKRPYSVWLLSGSPGLTVTHLRGLGLEADDRVGDNAVLNAGGGDVDVLTAEVSWPAPAAELRKIAQHTDAYTVNNDAIWGYLMANGSPGQAERLRDDPWQRPDAPLLTVQLAGDGTRGFSLGMEQLLRHGAMWLPEHDVYVTLADKPVSWEQHQASLTGERTLDRVMREPDASLAQFTRLWEDVGNPLVWDKPWESQWMGTKGHLIITAAAHGSLYKFAVDRWANVRPDHASPHTFRFDLHWPDSQWKGQRIENGLPLIFYRTGTQRAAAGN